MLTKAAALVLVCASLGLCLSCSFLSSSSSHYVYAAIPASSEIVAFREDPNAGVLIQLAGSPISAGQTVQALALDPSGKCLYAANAGQNNVSLFTINSDGSLTEQTPRTSVGTVPTLLVLDSSGHLYVGNSGSTDVSVLSVSCTSTPPFTPVTQLSGATAPIGLVPLNMQLSPSGNVLYVTGQGVVSGYIEAFPLTQGVLGVPIAGSPFTTGNNPYGMVINTAGTYLYTANKTDNTVSEFMVNSDGSLNPLPNSPIGDQYSGPVSLLIDKSQTYLYVADQGSTNVAGFTIASDGGLTVLSSSPFGAGSQPSFIAADPSGNYLFVGNQSSPSVQSFSLDTSTGALTEIGTYTVPGTPTSVVVAP